MLTPKCNQHRSLYAAASPRRTQITLPSRYFKCVLIGRQVQVCPSRTGPPPITADQSEITTVSKWVPIGQESREQVGGAHIIGAHVLFGRVVYTGETGKRTPINTN